MITIIDSGGANIASIQFSLQRFGVDAQLSRDVEIIKKSTHLILPGVGSASYAMQYLQQYNLIETILSLTQPVLGICLGMQLLFDFSEEGQTPCLGLIPGNIKKISPLNQTEKLIVPHMGWNKINIIKQNSILKNIKANDYAYFVHNYIAPVNEYTLAQTIHGINFSAIVNLNNFYGVQFHPERSSDMGNQLLQNFLEL